MSDQTKKLPESDSPAAPITSGGALAVPVVWVDPEVPAVWVDPEAPAVLGDPEVPAVLGAYVVLDTMAAKAAKWATCWAETMEER